MVLFLQNFHKSPSIFQLLGSKTDYGVHAKVLTEINQNYTETIPCVIY